MIKTASLTHITVHLSIRILFVLLPISLNCYEILNSRSGTGTYPMSYLFVPRTVRELSILNSLSTSSSISVNPPRDCSDVYDLGHDVNGYYNVTTSNGTQLEVYCDLTTDGGRWTRIFVHDLSMGVDYWNDFGSETKDPYLWNQENPRTVCTVSSD